MKTVFNRISACVKQVANRCMMSNTSNTLSYKTPRSASAPLAQLNLLLTERLQGEIPKSGSGLDCVHTMMSSESPTNHLLITYYSPTVVSMQSAAIKAVKRAYMSAWRYAAMLLIVLVMGIGNVWGANGDVLFSQDFGSVSELKYRYTSGTVTETYSYSSSGTTLSGLVGTGTNLFTHFESSIKKGDVAINSSTGGNSVNATGFFQAYSNGDNAGYWSLTRTSDFLATAPTALKVTMDIWFKNLSSGSENGVQFAIGDGFTGGLKSTTAQATSVVHSGFGIYANSTAKLTAYNAKGTVLYNTGITQSTWLSITWIINNTGESLTYNNPTGSGTTTLANDKFDVWLKTQAGAASTYIKIVSAAGASTASKDLQEIYIGYNQSGKKHEFRLDNIVVTDLTPAASCSAPTSPSISGTTAYTAGQDISLSASATGTSASTTYTWYKGATWAAASATTPVKASSTSPTFTKASCVVGDAGTYWCNISNGTGCEVQTSKTITVSAPPSSTYYYRGGDNSWGATAMTVSAGGLYEYYQSSNSSNQFKIALSSEGWDYNYSYVNSGYCSTNVTEIGDYKENGIPNNCYCWKSGTYYIIVFKPNTAMNATSEPIICASTTLPIESVTVSKTLTNVSVTGTAIPTTSNQCGSFSTTISASTGYNLPASITVTGASHTWNSSTGALTVNSITGNVAITIVGVAKTTTITLNANTANHGSGTNKSVTATYNAALPSFTACTPASGYSLTGYFTAATGGTKIINADGTLVASTTYTNASAKWTGTAATLTLYAQYAEFGGDVVIFDGSTMTDWATSPINGVSFTHTGISAADKGTITGESSKKYTKTLATGGSTGDSRYISVTIPTGYVGVFYIAQVTNSNGNARTAFISTTKTKTKGSSDWYVTSSSNTTASYGTSGVYSAGTYYINFDQSINFTEIRVNIFAPCTAPTGLSAGSITSSGATFTVTDGAGTNNYEFYYSTASTVPTSTTAATATALTTTKTVTGLTAATRYYAWVRSVCSSINKSSWVALTGSTFTTGCVAPTSVSVTGGGHYFKGNSITLTATPTGGAGLTTTYQWQKYNTSTSAWDNIGTNSATYTKTCALADNGRYRCIVSKGECSTTSNEVQIKILKITIKNSSDEVVIEDAELSYVDETTCTYARSLTGLQTYKFIITDGVGGQFGNTGEMISSNCTNWTMDRTDGTYCRVTTNSKTASYRFNVDYTNLAALKVSVEYPGSNQAAGKVVYYDNNVLKWTGTLYYRIGRGDHTLAIPLTKVTGTDNLYTFTTVEYLNFEYWHICNNAGWTGANPIDKTKTGDGYAITKSSSFQGAPITNDVSTWQPVTEGHIGEREQNNNCDFYDMPRWATSMKTWNATVNASTNGSIAVTYTDPEDDAQTISNSEGRAVEAVPHTCILNVAATPNAGYQLATLTVGGAAHTNNTSFVITAATTIAATFSPLSYTVTLNNQSATTAGTASVATTFNAYTNLTTRITVPTKTDYEFGGYYTGTGGTGVKLIDEAGNWIASVEGYTSATKQWLNPGNVTLYAYWIANEYCYTFTPATSGSAPSTGDVISGTGSGGTMTMLGGTFGYTANGLEFQSGSASKVSVSLDNNMAVGTVITATIYIGSASTRGLYLYNSSGTKKATFSQSAVGTYTFTYTVVAGDGLEGNNTFQLWRYNNATLKSLKIHHCGVAKIDPTVYTFSNGTFASWATCTAAATKKLTLSGSQLGVSYQLYKGGVAEGDPKAGTGSALEWLITASGVYTCKSVENTTYKEGTMTGTATVTIQDPTIVGETSVDVEGNITLTHPGDAASGSWATSDDSKATVSSTGVVTGVAEGSATITFTGTGGCTDTHVVSVVLPSSESCITISNFATSALSSTELNVYKGSISDANKVYTNITRSGTVGKNSGADMLLKYQSSLTIYNSPTTTTNFTGVTSVSFKVKATDNAKRSGFDVYVGSSKVATISGGDGGSTVYGKDAYTELTTGTFASKDGYVRITSTSSSAASGYDTYIDDIEICTASDGFVLNYNANGGTGTTTSQAGTSLTVKSCGFTRIGYAFDHWNTAADDSGTDYDPGDPITLTGTTTLYAQWVEEMESECSWAYYFVKASDATANGKTNNTSVFTTVLGGSPGSGGSSGSATVDGTTYTFTGGSGSVKTNTTMVVPTGKKATLYIVTKKNGTNTITVKKGSTEIGTHTPTLDFDVAEFDNLDAGTYTINSTGNLNWYLFAANICADCADSRPEITGSLTGCPTVTLTATNYTDGALLQWYKKVGSEFVALDGETGTTYTATETGLYKLAAQKTCRLETEPVSVTISLAVNSTAIPTATKTYEQGAAATPLTASVLAEGDAATTASEYLWQYQEWNGSAWGAVTTIDDATTSSYTPSTATVCRKRYRVGARNNCNEGVWKYSGYVIIDVIASSTVTGSWKVDGADVASSAKGYVRAVNAGGWYDVKATFTTTTATPTITMMTDGVKMDNRVVEGTTITARVYVPASAADTVRVKAAVEAVTTGTAYSSCEIILKLAVNQCASNTKLPVKASSTDAGSGYTGWRYYWETAGVGKITAKTGTSTISQESSSYEGFSYRNGSNGPEYRFQTYIGGVSKVRVYVYNDASSVRTVSNVYYHTALFTDKPSGYEISPTIIYQYPDEGGIKGKSNSYFDIVLSTPMIPNSCLAIILNNNVKIYGVELTGSSGSGTVPTLQWNQSGSATLEDIHTSPGSSLMQKASIKTPDNFKSIAGIQYRSTNSDIATVDNATGEVTIVSPSTILVAETCSIAAKLPVSGCYAGSADIYYRVIVDPCPDKAPVIATDRNDYCVGHEPVISITSYDGEITGWFKDGVKIPDTEGLTSITASGIGNYYVTTHKTCDVDVRSNSIVIVAAAAPSVTVLHSGWHIRRGREIGVPLQLFKVEGTNLTTTIEWTLNGASHKLTGVSCSLVDGIYQMTGTPSGSGAATLTGTITVTNECGQSTTKSTTIIVDPAAANIQVAYVVKGTKGGGWTATQDDNLTGLYTYLSSVPTFDVTACNGYNTTVLEDLLTYYSQYDVVVLTDYLNSGEKPGSGNPGYNKSNNISYSDAFGCLVDVKPMLTTEAYVSGKSQWTKVGLTSNPSDGTNTDNQSLKMRLLCPSAAIFTSIDPSTIDGEKYIQVADALPGGTENKMLQGFAPTAARDFVFMATVMGGDGKELITLCERQTQIRARMLVFGLNWHGSQVLNTDGKTAVKQMIEYLMRWDPDQVIDCAIYFNDKTGDHKWSTAANWGPAYNHVPKYYENVRIEQPVIVDVPNAVAANVRIAVNAAGSSVTGASDETVTSPKVLNGEIEIPSNGSLTINGGIYKVISDGARDFVTKHQADHHVLSVGSSSTGQGALAFAEANNNMLPDAVVAIYGRGVDGDQYDPTWQYIGIPYQSAVAIRQFYNSWLCEWHQDGSWTYVGDHDRLQPFKGYALTQVSSVVYTNNGLLVKPQKMSFTLQYSSGPYKEYNLLANSFTAPIDINAFEDDDFDNAEKTIYIYNTGAYTAWSDDAGGTYSQTTTSAGQYLAIPIHAAPYTSQSVIPSTQAFFVKANSGGGTLTIDYDRTVLQIDSVIAGASKTTSALRAPRRRMMQQGVNDGEMGDILTTKITLQGETGGDILHVLTGSEDFTDGFDDGWDGEKWAGDSNKPYFAIHSDTMDYSVSSQPKLEGTILTFRPGVDEIYDLTIVTPVRGLVLTDLVSNIDIPLADTTYYTFSATSRTEQGRFIIRRKPQIATDNIVQTADYVSAFATNGQICVANKTTTQANASVFDATGKLIYYNTLSPNSTQFIDIPVASGVYLVRIVTGQESRTIKVTF